MLRGHTLRCYLNFASYYNKVQHRMQKTGIAYIDPPLAEKKALLSELADCADDNGIAPYACCQERC